MNELIGRLLGVVIVVLASFLLIAFVKWNIDVRSWSDLDRITVFLLPVVVYGFNNTRDWLAYHARK